MASRMATATTLEKLRAAERWRITSGPMGSSETDGWNGYFLVPLDGELWKVLISDGLGWRHLSVSNAQKKVIPSWQTMCRLRDLFFDTSSWVVQYHPPRETYVNDHPFTLHLWEPLEETLPTPPVILV
jgi:hypothetical protein